MIALANQAELAERIRHDDSAAETEFVRHFAPRILLMCVARTHDPEASRDLVQEVLLASLTAIHQERLREEEKISAFVLGVTRNLINNFLRRRSQDPATEPLTDCVGSVSIEMELEASERRRMLQAALQQLSADERQVLLLTLVDGWKPAEVAVQLGVTSEVVRTRKLRALRKVKERVERLSRKAPWGPHT